MVYLLNTPILTSYGHFEFSGPLSITEVKQALAGGYKSAIGHQATADLLSQLLEQPIEANREAIHMAVGDRAVIFRLKQRIAEGVVLSQQELGALPTEFSLLTKVKGI